MFESFFFLNRAVYEIMWKNMAEVDMPQMTTQSGVCALRATKATHSEYVLFLFLGNNGNANASQCYLYAYIACLVNDVIICLVVNLR